jgi:hypothetical protein
MSLPTFEENARGKNPVPWLAAKSQPSNTIFFSAGLRGSSFAMYLSASWCGRAGAPCPYSRRNPVTQASDVEGEEGREHANHTDKRRSRQPPALL